jgi:hypothetical protein
MSASPQTTNNSAENNLQEVPEKYGLDIDYDFRDSGRLPEGAVAATVKTETPEVYRIKSYDDFLESDGLAILNGELAGIDIEDEIGFIENEAIYSEIDEEVKEYVELHEGQHFIQYSDDYLWGNHLDESYGLSKKMKNQLNEIDRLMDISEDPVLGNLVDEAEVTALVEGYTERITQAMHEDGDRLGEDFYPGYTQLADKLMRESGINPEKEFDISG